MKRFYFEMAFGSSTDSPKSPKEVSAKVVAVIVFIVGMGAILTMRAKGMI